MVSCTEFPVRSKNIASPNLANQAVTLELCNCIQLCKFCNSPSSENWFESALHRSWRIFYWCEQLNTDYDSYALIFIFGNFFQWSRLTRFYAKKCVESVREYSRPEQSSTWIRLAQLDRCNSGIPTVTWMSFFKRTSIDIYRFSILRTAHPIPVCKADSRRRRRDNENRISILVSSKCVCIKAWKKNGIRHALKNTN